MGLGGCAWAWELLVWRMARRHGHAMRRRRRTWCGRVVRVLVRLVRDGVLGHVPLGLVGVLVWVTRVLGGKKVGI